MSIRCVCKYLTMPVLVRKGTGFRNNVKALAAVSGNHITFTVKHFQNIAVYPVTAFSVGTVVPFNQQ
ncbi:hypothetical protein GCM10011338_31130 [Alteromonas lipolytica]|nr:hypothetical protein GCM10011338_31130 [Alteromonas lipolytica]